MVLANFSFSSDKFAALTQRKLALCWEVSYKIFVISDTNIHDTQESYLYLHQYLFCKSKIPYKTCTHLCLCLVNIFHPIFLSLNLIFLLC